MSDCDTAWRRPRTNYSLLPDEVHVWRASLDQPQGHFVRLKQILSPQERARANRFHFEADRKRCVLARGLLRLLIGHCLGTPADRLRFQYGEFGKPSLARGPYPNLQFNLSHSGDLVLIALSYERAVGVDVERMRIDVATDEIAARFFSANECRDLAKVPPEMRCAAFFECWTRKEAYLKARGDGLSLPLEQFDVSFLGQDKPRLIEARHDPTEVSRWTLHALEGGGGYKAALAVEGADWKLRCWDWPSVTIGAMSGDMFGSLRFKPSLPVGEHSDRQKYNYRGLGANIASRRRTQCAAATAADCDDFAAPMTTLTLGFQDCHHALD
jgi:4'-phosphopantetheinyl transferase